jgi:outer membrane protein TolC
LFAQQPLDWPACFSRTVSNNLELSIARLALKEAEAELGSQKSVLYPSVSASASRTTGETDGDSANSTSAGLSASYTIFSGFGNRARINRSEAELQAEQANFDQTRSNIEYDLRAAFADQLYAQELIELAETIEQRRADNVKLVDMRYEGGSEHKGSLLLSQAQHTQAQFEVQQAHRDLELARRKLARMMGEMVYDSFFITGDLTAGAPPESERLMALAEKTPSYRSAEAALSAAKAGFELTRSDRFPEIKATGSLTRSGEEDFETDSWRAGVSISFPLFTGGQLSQDILASGLRKEQSQLNREETLFDILVDLQSARNNYTDACETMDVQQAFVEAAELRAEVARVQYQQGLLSFEDWDRIENDLITRQKNQLSSRRNAMKAEAAWRNTIGLSTIQ